MATPLKAPFPYFGGKSKIAGRVWELFGPTRNYVEPFAGSLAILLNRPTPVIGCETVNDYSCHVVNAWRAIQTRPEELGNIVISPCAEVDKESANYNLVTTAEDLRNRLGDPAFCDVGRAAWWIKGCAEWIGGGYCDGSGPWSWSRESGWEKRGNGGRGVNRQLPHLGDGGRGVNRQLPHLGDGGTGQYQQRVQWATDWLCALRDRLCHVRIACGDWSRVCGPFVTHKHGLTAVFLDPPYDGTENVYSKAQASVSGDVNLWCLENGDNEKLRIILAGRGEEHDNLLAHGWRKEIWSGMKGYSNTGDRHGEAMWYNFDAIGQGSLGIT